MFLLLTLNIFHTLFSVSFFAFEQVNGSRTFTYSRHAHTCSKSIIETLKKVKLAALLEVKLLHGCFSRFLNCTNGTAPV